VILATSVAVGLATFVAITKQLGGGKIIEPRKEGGWTNGGIEMSCYSKASNSAVEIRVEEDVLLVDDK